MGGERRQLPNKLAKWLLLRNTDPYFATKASGILWNGLSIAASEALIAVAGVKSRQSRRSGRDNVRAKKNTIVIGIDFGTTFSGISWAFAGQPKNIEVITQWPSELSFNSDTEKTPSTLLYGTLQDDATWGYSVPAHSTDECLKWFKLLLIDPRDLSPELRESAQIATAKRLLETSNREVVEVISSYLQRLWNHSIDCIARSTGKGLLRLCTFRVVVTIPAIWPEYSKARMRRAAGDAGILDIRPAGETVLSFVTEPEAAALATLCDLRFRPDIKVALGIPGGDHFVVCDAGGGTVDLTSYEAVTTDPLVVKEAVKGDGRLCGCLFLDQAFVEMMRSKVGSHVWDALPNEEIRQLLHNDWEHGIKKQFHGQDRDWVVTLPYGCRSAADQISRARKSVLILNNSDLEPVFCQIVRQIEDLVKKQVEQVQLKHNKSPKASKSYDTHFSRLWSAICRGAVIRGLTQARDSREFPVKIASRIARISYGTTFYETFNPTIHLNIDRAWDEKEMKWVANNQVQWYLKQVRPTKRRASDG
ncbi:hsp70 family chaperone [Colletotrichum kahawae]|uniref:Hsp70 family chaperone n=1 Tax=Colletotrichum kahawae TaxID=34407 RepID=A0AAD9YGT6_COLKA|nr:hsp70 family chaperone [Colletotrichum kahawae]